MTETKTEVNEITVNGIQYVKKGTEQATAQKIDGMEYVICRTYSAGVFAGYLKERSGREAKLLYARRLWKWSGAASLSQLAMEGTKNPKDCKFPCEVNEILLLESIEIIPCTETSRLSIRGVETWEI
jgi:hypothetical protein